MSIHVKVAGGIIVVGLIALLAYKILLPVFETSSLQNSSDAKGTKGKISIGVDSWIGYFPLCSPEMKKRLRRSGYLLECLDDSANYDERMRALQENNLQFAVATVDSYLKNAKKYHYPATIVAVIDESKGGDAIVAIKDKIKSLETLKKRNDYKIAYTPASPSEFLLESMAVHFDVKRLLDNKQRAWAVETDGSAQALKAINQEKVDVAVLWEPDVTRALSNPKLIKLLGTEDTHKLIVDILLVNRKYSQKQPEAVNELLKTYFRVLKFYRENPLELIEDAKKYTDLKEDQVKPMLKGVQWANLTENAIAWMGSASAGAAPEYGLAETIENTAQVMIEHGDFEHSPVPSADPYTLINSQFIQELFGRSMTSTQFGSEHTRSAGIKPDNGLTRDFEKLSAQQWNSLRQVGSLKIRPIVFQSGSAELTPEGKHELEKAIANLKHYPNFRVLVKGHTGTRGDADANQKLSQQRAETVATFLVSQYGADVDRFRPLGLGSSEPLTQKPGESFRAYNYRLPRVELVLMAENI